MTEPIETYPDAPTPVQLIAVCHTDGCPTDGQEFVNAYYPYGTFDPPRYMGQCGRCQQPITDLRPAPASDSVSGDGEAFAPTPVPVALSTHQAEGAL